MYKSIKPHLIIMIAGLALVSCTQLDSRPISADASDLPRISPEEAGWSTAKLDEMARLAGDLGYSALMLVHDGRVMYSWGDVETDYKCHSIRKPFLSALYGIQVEKGTVDLELTLAELNIDDISPVLSVEEKKATIRHLLQGRSGVYHEAAGETAKMKQQRPERGSHSPGTFFYYNNWDFNTLGTIFEHLTGSEIFKAFEREIADPIGMQDFKASRCNYQFARELSKYPKYAFRMSARDMARFGVVYQKNGVWNGKRIIPEDWIKKSTTAYSEQDGGGFGYLWGIIMEGSPLARLLGGTGIFFSGVGVHNLVVLPEKKLVFVLRMDTDGNWNQPDRKGNAKLYSLLAEARIN